MRLQCAECLPMTMKSHEYNLYALAERLNMAVWQVKQMPCSEYFGWLRYLQEQAERREIEERKAKGDMTVMTPAEIVSRLT